MKSIKKVILDVNHPAHVHFIRNLYFELLLEEGIEVLVVASKKPLVYELLNSYGIPHIKIGAYGNSLFSKAINLLWLNLKMLSVFLNFKPQIIIGIVTIRGAHIAWLLRKISIVFTDTEHATGQIKLFKPFASKIYTPINFPVHLGTRHIYHNSYHELAYLHPNYFQPDESVLSTLGINDGEKYSIVRFVAWNATHDRGMTGLTDANKIEAVTTFLRYGKVFITSEIGLPSELIPFAIRLDVNKIHHAIYYSSLVFGESATMASEAAVLGVPAVYIDNAGRCYTREQEEKYNIVYNYKDDAKSQNLAIEKGVELLKMPVETYRPKRAEILKDKENMTNLLSDIILQLA